MSDDNKTVRKTIFSTGGACLVLLILVLANYLLSNVAIRWDATKDNLYSFSEGTEKIISELKEDVVIKVFFSKSVANIPPNIKTFAHRVQDFLSEYEQKSSGKITIETYDPKLDSEEEEWAQTYGMKSINLNSGEKVYLGLVAMAADQEELIPFIDPTREANLEYDITRAISRVQTAHKLAIGIIGSLPIFGRPAMGMPGQGGMEPWFFVQELKKTYDVKEILPTSDKIDQDLDLLILFHPRNLSDSLMYAIDQFVLSGGNVILYADPMSLMDDPRMGATGSSIDPLMKAWGVSLVKGKAVADYGYATRLRNRSGQIENNPLWLSIPKQAFSSDEIIISGLESMLLPVAGALKHDPESTLSFTPLIQSTENAALVEAFKHSMDVSTLRKTFKPAGEKFTLAAKISGSFKSAFPEGKPVDKKKDKDKALKEESIDDKTPHLKEASKPATIIVVADSDLLYDGYYLSRQNFLGFAISNIFNDNLNFLLNASEMLTGNDALIEIRSRGVFERPFTKVRELEAKAQAKWLDQEQALVKKADEANEKLRLLEKQKDASQKAILSPEQEKEIARFQEEKRKINKELKIVRRNLRSDIESLGKTIKFINIFLMPIIICIGGIVFAIYKRRNRYV